MPARSRACSPQDTSLKLHPFATTHAFGNAPSAAIRRDVTTVLSSRLLPAFTGRGLLTTTGSSATSHRVNRSLSRPLNRRFRSLQATGRCQASPVTVLFSFERAPCWRLHPQPRPVLVHESGIALFCTLTPTGRRIRFAFAMNHQLSMASFRPRRWPATPLPFELSSP